MTKMEFVVTTVCNLAVWFWGYFVGHWFGVSDERNRQEEKNADRK